MHFAGLKVYMDNQNMSFWSRLNKPQRKGDELYIVILWIIVAPYYVDVDAILLLTNRFWYNWKNVSKTMTNNLGSTNIYYSDKGYTDARYQYLYWQSFKL